LDFLRRQINMLSGNFLVSLPYGSRDQLAPPPQSKGYSSAPPDASHDENAQCRANETKNPAFNYCPMGHGGVVQFWSVARASYHWLISR
ncbi:hypothetical protein MY1884_009610, partial [Beauveria asiatica]